MSNPDIVETAESLVYLVDLSICKVKIVHLSQFRYHVEEVQNLKLGIVLRLTEHVIQLFLRDAEFSQTVKVEVHDGTDHFEQIVANVILTHVL